MQLKLDALFPNLIERRKKTSYELSFLSFRRLLLSHFFYASAPDSVSPQVTLIPGKREWSDS